MPGGDARLGVVADELHAVGEFLIVGHGHTALATLDRLVRVETEHADMPDGPSESAVAQSARGLSRIPR